MTATGQSDNLRGPWLIAGLVILAVIAALFDTFASMYRLWVSIDQFNHCLLIAPATVWMIWRRRQALALIDTRISPVGLLAFVLVAGLWALGTIGRVAIVQHVSAVALIPLSIWALLGTQVVRSILFPLGYLFFLVPFGGALIPVLMEFTADMTVAAVRMSGVPIYHDGLYLAIPNGSFRIIEACSGIRMLFAGVAVGALFAYLNFRSYSRRSIFLCWVIVLCIVANWLRAYVVIMAAHLSGMDLVADHIWLGYVIFSLVIVIMLWGGSRYSDIVGDESSAHADPVAGSPVSVSLGATLSIAVLLVSTTLSMPLLAAAGIERAAQVMTGPVVRLPQSGKTGWIGPERYDELWSPIFIGDTAIEAGHYRGQDGNVDMLVISYRSLSADSELINETNRFYDSERWVLIGRRDSLAQNANGDPIPYAQTRLRSSSGNHLIFRYWYVVDGWPLRNPYAIKLVELKNALLGRPTPQGAVFVSTRAGEDTTGADELLDEFMATMIR